MSKSKRSHEGYLVIDHRSTDGLSEEMTQAQGLPPGAGQGLFEAPTYCCSHCTAVVILNPLRNRERAYCRHCDHYICDSCGAILKATGVCKTFKQIVEETQERALKKGL